MVRIHHDPKPRPKHPGKAETTFKIKGSGLLCVRMRPMGAFAIREQLWGQLPPGLVELPPMPLTETAIRKAKPEGEEYKLTDGGGLYL